MALMRETWHMIEGVCNNVELVTEESMMSKVVAQLLKPLIWRRRGR
jgi:hypothetical protein